MLERMGLVIGQGSLKTTKPVGYLKYLACHSNGTDVTLICLQNGNYKQNFCHFFGKTAFINTCVTNYSATTITYLIYNHW